MMCANKVTEVSSTAITGQQIVVDYASGRGHRLKLGETDEGRHVHEDLYTAEVYSQKPQAIKFTLYLSRHV